MYSIYHIPEYVHKDGSIGKIGVTQSLKRRINNYKGLKLSDMEVLEEHTDVYKVSDREIELQKEYGYKVDCLPYYKALYMGKAKLVHKDHLDKIHKLNSKIVLAYNKITNEFIGEFESTMDTAKKLNCSSSKVSEVCNGRRPWTKGFIFKYKED